MVFAERTPRTLITTYLEMSRPARYEMTPAQFNGMHIEKMTDIDIDLYLFIYQSVGEKLRWRDRLQITRDELYTELSKPTTFIYVLYIEDEVAGYIELSKQAKSVEIAYFGLREKFWGRGYGKSLLNYGIDQAWQLGAERIWLHTCNLDGEHALANYQKRGFNIYEECKEPMPAVYQ